jgi:UDP-2-acetamido-2-deoxy-ribo-hexuluronate aminotransferase
LIPFFDLAAQQQVLRNEIDANIAKVLAHGKYILGPEVVELEDRLVEYTGANIASLVQMVLTHYKLH